MLKLLCWVIVLTIIFALFISNSDQQLFRPGQEPQNVINSLLTPILLRSECTAAVDNRMGLCMPKSACLRFEY
ncbi:hypothetical protein BLA29_012149 [Euroglyphus maynei]|uniref:Uncharacterized protein n=1 Tax=Euroglyphus maynei TaxID=6958 RepID=A0A1Y3AL81_EURMA|nr:hypothetical protein BLA29_012149 [Euroglyphus maynei]